MTEILFARKTDVDSFAASLATINGVLNAADFVTGTAQAGLGAERVATTSTSIVTTLTAGIISWERAALTGDITATQNSNATTLATVNANVGSWGLAASVPQFTVNGKGLITAAVNVPISILSTAVSDFTEAAQDAVGAAMGNTATINITYNDAGNAITAAVNNNSIGNAQFRQGVARSVVGVTGNAGANVADIQGTADQVLVVNTAGTALAFGTVATGGITAAAVTYAKMQNVAASRLLGNPTGSAASPSEIDLNATLSFTGTSLQRAALTGDATATAGSNAMTVLQASTTWALTGIISPAQLAANTNDWAPASLSTAAVIRFSTDASRNITGLTGGATGRLMTLLNIGTQIAVLKNEDVGSTAANRFAIGADISMTGGTSVTLIYDTTSSRWRPYAGAGSGGGGTVIPVDVQVFTTTGTWTRPAGVTWVQVFLCGGGGGGGGGARMAAATATTGGTGGGGGYCWDVTFKAADAGASQTVTIAAGGTAGAAAGADNTVGGNGGVGGSSTFGSLLTAFGGGPGLGGQSALGDGTGGGGAGSNEAGGIGTASGASGLAGRSGGADGGAASGSAAASKCSSNGGAGGGGCFRNTATAAATGGWSQRGGPGGGGGGGITATNVANAGGAGGSSLGHVAQAAGGATGVAGTNASAPAFPYWPGGGGGGGGGHATTPGAGGNGTVAGGGGGAGTRQNGGAAVAGGTGGPGVAYVVSW